MARTQGDTIAIQNPSFEALTGSDPAYFGSSGALLPGHGSQSIAASHDPSVYLSADPIPGWKQAGGAGGTINYNATPYFSTAATDGQNVAWANAFQGIHTSISQTLGTTYQAGLTYELKVDVSSPINLPLAGFTVSLYAGNTVIASAVNSVSIVPGAFSTVTVDASISSGSVAEGQPITISLANTGTFPTSTEVTFDNVRLASTATVPEPSTWVLAGLGLLALVTVGRRNQRR